MAAYPVFIMCPRKDFGWVIRSRANRLVGLIDRYDEALLHARGLCDKYGGGRVLVLNAEGTVVETHDHLPVAADPPDLVVHAASHTSCRASWKIR